MPKKLINTLIVISILSWTLIAANMPATGQPGIAGEWDRLNPGLPPEHEVLRCGGNTNWYCTYDKHPEPGLGFVNPPNSTFGTFRGENITTEWTCPEWFPTSICNNTTFVAGGMMKYALFSGGELSVNEELILVENDGNQVLYMYWVDQFICPWYRTFDEALAANPLPLPFNGVDGGAMDCLIAP